MNPPRRSGPSRKGFARIIHSRGRGESALILGQRPTSPKGVQCYVGPLAHCGSHCCANCITTGSGRDLPSVARNSVSRGLVPGTAQCNSNDTTSYTRRQTSPARSTAAVTFIALRGTLYVASMPRSRTSAALLRVARSKRVLFHIYVAERILIARAARQSARRAENARPAIEHVRYRLLFIIVSCDNERNGNRIFFPSIDPFHIFFLSFFFKPDPS